MAARRRAAGRPTTPIQQLLLNAERNLYSAERVLLSKEVAATQGGQQSLARSLQRVCRMGREALRHERNGLGSEPEDRSVEALALRYQQFTIDLVREHLKYFAETDQTYFPPEIQWTVRRLLSEIDPDQKFQLILHPSDDPVPRIKAIDWLERKEAELLFPQDAARVSAVEEGPLYVFISYPQVNSRNPFVHTLILSHEVLHLRDNMRGLSSSLASRIRLNRPDIDELVASLSGQPLLPATPSLPPVTFGERFTEDQLRATIGTRWAEVISSWMSEIATDLMAVRLYGPCYAAAFTDHSLASGVMHDHSDTHPCSRFRLEFILEELRLMGYTGRSAGLLRIAVQQISDIRALLKGAPRRGQLIHNKAEQYIRNEGSAVADAVRLEVRDSYNAKMFAERVPTLVEYLEHGVPPGQILGVDWNDKKPAGLPSILNGAYVFQASKMDVLLKLLRADDPESQLEARLKLDELLLKAIELNEVTLAWENAADHGEHGVG